MIDICPFATVPPRMLCHGIPCRVVLASRVSLFVVGHPQHVQNQMFMLRVIGVVLGVFLLGVLAALALLHARRAGSGGAYPIRDRESSMVRERPNGNFSTERFLQYVSVSLSAISITSSSFES